MSLSPLVACTFTHAGAAIQWHPGKDKFLGVSNSQDGKRPGRLLGDSSFFNYFKAPSVSMAFA